MKQLSPLALSFVAVLASCDRPPDPTPSESPAAAAPARVTEDEQAALTRAEQAVRALGTRLRERLSAASAAGGPTLAMEVCAGEAGLIRARVREETGVRVDRASLRERGSHDTPAWVSTWLSEQGERPAEGVEGLAQIEGGRARVLRPIVVEAQCLGCHGESIAPEVAAILDARYPNDGARGYRLGDLRGAIWAEVDLP